MGLAVCNGAMCQCTFGSAPCTLTVTSETNTIGCNMPLATIMDNTPANLASFGICISMTNPAVASATAAALGVLTPQPCTPIITAPWTPGSPSVLINNKPALNNNSKLICSWAGIIQIVNPGQQNIQVP